MAASRRAKVAKKRKIQPRPSRAAVIAFTRRSKAAKKGWETRRASEIEPSRIAAKPEPESSEPLAESLAAAEKEIRDLRRQLATANKFIGSKGGKRRGQAIATPAQRKKLSKLIPPVIAERTADELQRIVADAHTELARIGNFEHFIDAMPPEWLRRDKTLALHSCMLRATLTIQEQDSIIDLLYKAESSGELEMTVRELSQKSGLSVKELYTLFYSP